MNSTAKITSLVAVLVLCCAGLAGSAYAYTATYVDTIDDQPIEDVYLTINDNIDGVTVLYGDMDLDAEYSTYTFERDVDDVPTTLTYFKAEQLTINDTEQAVTPVDNVFTYIEKIDSVKVKAYGDDASFTLSAIVKAAGAAYDPAKFTANGITVNLVLQPTGAAPAGTAAHNTVVSGQELVAGESAIYDLYVIIIVDQLGTDFEVLDVIEPNETYYEADKTMGNIILPALEITFRATATQA